MLLKAVSIRNLRIIKEAEFRPGTNINLIIGGNGSGKTSLLESIYFLSRTRSFRTNRFTDVLRQQEDVLSVSATIASKTAAERRITVRRSKDKLKVQSDGRDLSKATELLRILPLGLMLPGMTGLLEQGPRERRRLLDWLLFHVEPEFMNVWQAYHKAMRHRTAALRSNESTVAIWEKKMEEAGSLLSDMRVERMRVVESAFSKLLEGLFQDDLELRFKAGWRSVDGLADLLASRRNEDLSLGYAGVGPHRMDLSLRSGGSLASRTLSRGQMKLAVVGLVSAFVRSLKVISGEAPVFLLDDFGAELDSDHAAKLALILGRLDCQCIITSTDQRHQAHWDSQTLDMFHVEHGEIHAVPA